MPSPATSGPGWRRSPQFDGAESVRSAAHLRYVAQMDMNLADDRYRLTGSPASQAAPRSYSRSNPSASGPRSPGMSGLTG